AGDDAAVLTQHLRLGIGAQPALGREDAAVERHRDKGRLLDRRKHRPLLGLRLLEDGLAAMEVLVATGGAHAVEPLDGGRERAARHRDALGERGDRRGANEPIRIIARIPAQRRSQEAAVADEPAGRCIGSPSGPRRSNASPRSIAYSLTKRLPCRSTTIAFGSMWIGAGIPCSS